MSIIKNCPAMTEDVNIADKTFGPVASSLKRKSTRCKPKPVRTDLIEIPKELMMKHQQIELRMDGKPVNDCGTLTAVDHAIKLRSLAPMNTRQCE
jgi:hypothetical protein